MSTSSAVPCCRATASPRGGGSRGSRRSYLGAGRRCSSSSRRSRTRTASARSSRRTGRRRSTSRARADGPPTPARCDAAGPRAEARARRSRDVRRGDLGLAPVALRRRGGRRGEPPRAARRRPDAGRVPRAAGAGLGGPAGADPPHELPVRGHGVRRRHDPLRGRGQVGRIDRRRARRLAGPADPRGRAGGDRVGDDGARGSRVSRDVAMVGVAESDLGLTGASILRLQTQATCAALEDAGLTIRDLDGLCTNGLSRFSTAQLAEYLGISPVWTDSTFAGGASYEIFIGRAMEAIRAGVCETVLVAYGSNQRSARSRRPGGLVRGAVRSTRPDLPLRDGRAPAHARVRHDDGAACRGGGRGPRMGAPQPESLPSPLGPAHCRCGARVPDGELTAARARTLRRPPIAVLGYGEATTNQGMSAIPDLTSTGAVEAGRRAFEMAGLGAADIDVVELYDSFTITVLLTLEALGFCGRGEAGAYVAGGRLAPGGDRPINTSGGGLSYCHPGMFGIFLLIEAVRQLRGEAGPRPLPRARTAVCHGTGGMLSTHATVVLG